MELDPGYAQAYAYKAFWCAFFAGQGLSTDFAADAREAEIAAQRALSLDPADALVHAVAGHVRSFLLKQPRARVEMFDGPSSSTRIRPSPGD